MKYKILPRPGIASVVPETGTTEENLKLAELYHDGMRCTKFSSAACTRAVFSSSVILYCIYMYVYM